MFKDVLRDSGDMSKRTVIARTALLVSSAGLAAACGVLPQSTPKPTECQRMEKIGTFTFQQGDGLNTAVLGGTGQESDHGAGTLVNENACYQPAIDDVQTQLNNLHHADVSKSDAFPQIRDRVTTYVWHAGPHQPGQ
jgi:hypothetical protein